MAEFPPEAQISSTLGGTHDGLLKTSASRQDIAQSSLWYNSEHSVNAGATQISVNQEHSGALLSQNYRTVDAGGRLALLRKGAGDEDYFGGAPTDVNSKDVRKAR